MKNNQISIYCIVHHPMYTSMILLFLAMHFVYNAGCMYWNEQNPRKIFRLLPQMAQSALVRGNFSDRRFFFAGRIFEVQNHCLGEFYYDTNVA